MMTGWNKLGLRGLCLVLLLPVVVPPVVAQTLGAVEQRLDRLEKRMLQREAKVASGEAVLQLEKRLTAVERAIATLVSREEADRRKNEMVAERVERLQGDVEARLGEVEALLVKARADRPVVVEPPSPPVAKQDSADDRYREAEAFVKGKQWAKAEWVLEAFGDDYPEDPRAQQIRFWLGRSMQEQGRTAQAAQIFLQLYEQYPAADFALDNLFALAGALADLGPETAVQACDVYAEIDAGYKDRLSEDQRSALLDRRIALNCGA